MNPKSTSRTKSSLLMGNRPEQSEGFSDRNSGFEHTTGDNVATTRYEESVSTPRKRLDGRKKSAEGCNVSRNYITRNTRDLDDNFGIIQEFDNCRASGSPQSTKNQAQIHRCSSPKKVRDEGLELERAPVGTAMRVRQSSKKELSLKRKNTVTSSRVGAEAETFQSFPSAARKFQKASSTRRRLVDSLDVPVESIMDRSAASSPDKQSRILRFPRLNQESHQSLSQVTMNMNKDRPTNNRQQSPTISSRLRGSMVTYARQRSFLNDIPLADNVKDGESSSNPPDHESAFIISGLASQNPEGVDEIDDENSDSKPVRSIHELRQAGDNARFCETVDLILEDIEDSSDSVSKRCDGFVRLCVKLSDPRFAGLM
ncbi:uncharacterized protein ATNIH1004_009934 [Aspergillus tanneri]|uniref:Wings apart-like protein C-terminal domain-containing protein n=1 Tax=Aspergillus tanneri TaxID=1220188 RepID=A0A5M9M800_9EURO|nr:uncharacterized protein ATNIH1004_009934 [Aspergillus tanneri]KAA8643172.1 hypothetical protein ATNIH1004_009934 [Aspergillus tanneri]